MEEKEITKIFDSVRTITIDGREQPIMISPRFLSTEEIKQLKQRWKELHTGEGNGVVKLEWRKTVQ